MDRRDSPFIKIGHHVLMIQAIESFRYVAGHNELEIRTMSGATHRLSVADQLAADDLTEDIIQRIYECNGSNRRTPAMT